MTWDVGDATLALAHEATRQTYKARPGLAPASGEARGAQGEIIEIVVWRERATKPQNARKHATGHPRGVVRRLRWGNAGSRICQAQQAAADP